MGPCTQYQMKKPKRNERNERNRGPRTQYQMKNPKEMKEIWVPAPCKKWKNIKERKEMKEIRAPASSKKWKTQKQMKEMRVPGGFPCGNILNTFPLGWLKWLKWVQNEMNETAFPLTFKEMKEIHFITCLGYYTRAPWDDPAHLKQCGSYHSDDVDPSSICRRADSSVRT